MDLTSWTPLKHLTGIWEAGSLLEQNCPDQCMDWGQQTSTAVSWSLVTVSYSSYTRHHRDIIIAGGKDDEPFNDDYDGILEYDPEEDSMVPVGHMTQARSYHAVSVVQVQDYAQWCQWCNNLNMRLVLNMTWWFLGWPWQKVEIYMQVNCSLFVILWTEWKVV